MRLTAPILTFLSTAIFSGVAIADAAPKRSPELQVLDHFVGTWKTVVTVTTGGQTSTKTSFVTRAWSDGGAGHFVVESGKPKLDDPISYTHGAFNYDPKGKVYRFTFMDRELTVMNSFMLVRHGHVVAEGWWARQRGSRAASTWSSRWASSCGRT